MSSPDATGRGAGPHGRTGRPLRSVSEALDRLTSELGLQGARPAAALHEAWAAAAGPEVSAHAKPGRLRDGVLTVSVDDPAWATHVKYLGPALVRRLNGLVEGAPVASLRVVVTSS